MQSYSDRNNYQRKSPPRNLTEVAPERLRFQLKELMIESFGVLETHRKICKKLYISDEGVFSGDWAMPRIDQNIENLEWFEVFDLLEFVVDQASTWERDDIENKVNNALANSGLAYEMRGYQIERLDESGHEFGVHGDEERAVNVLSGEFSPVKEQYEKALSALHGRPADLKLAIANSLNALEAVTRIITKKDSSQLGECISVIFGKTAESHHKTLASMLKTLYGYASTVPGARHAQHTEAEVSFEEALMCVRISGAAMAYLVAEHHRQKSSRFE